VGRLKQIAKATKRSRVRPNAKNGEGKCRGVPDTYGRKTPGSSRILLEKTFGRDTVTDNKSEDWMRQKTQDENRFLKQEQGKKGRKCENIYFADSKLNK